MKYEIIETLYRAEKNNGECFVLNKIAWDDGYKYDLRVWQDNTPMQGIVFDDVELNDFFEQIWSKRFNISFPICRTIDFRQTG